MSGKIEIKSAEQAIACLEEYGSNYFKLIPKKFRTPKVYHAAVKQDNSALKYVPEHLKIKVCLFALGHKHDSVFMYMPKKLKTPEVCLAAVKCCCSNLKYVPKALRNQEVCLAAANSPANDLEDILKYVPKGFKSQVCKIAVQKDGWLLRFVPNALKTPEICLAAVKNNIHAFTEVPNSIKSHVEKLLG
ncbi:MAG: DUF4116 domain-containing protein [Fibromonadaceae bacterium]|jgi:hypothetical protein|nr:DUF4116 domain-containing protein [Fibromonadaceae bacterium]